jgi:hypothetical protein
MNLSPGVVFNDYRILSRLGVGGMAEVWKAEQSSTGRQVAVKIILETISEDPKFGERFFREARVLKRLKHPNIIQIVEFGEVEGEPFIVTPLLTGGSLADRIRAGRVGESAIPWLKGLASALDFAHAEGVIHRDVKPTNVLFDEADNPYLSDFGLAKACSSSELTTTGAAMGTPLYMSPEQVRGDELDERSDAYSLGVVAYQLVCGKRPFAGDSVATVLHKTLHVMPEPPSSIDPQLPASVDAVLLRVLAKDRRRRYDTCGRFVTELEKALDGTPSDWVPKSFIGEAGVTHSGVSIPHFTAVTRKGMATWQKMALGAVVVLALAGLWVVRGRLAPRAKDTPEKGGSGSVGVSGPSPIAGLMAAKADLQGLHAVLQAYAIDQQGFPQGPWGNALRELERGYGSARTMPSRDPWGQAYRYVVSGDGRAYVLASPGADGVYQNQDRVLGRLLETRCKGTRQIRGGDDATTDVIVCNGSFLTAQEYPTGTPR